ncbi:hypothetical protein NVIE_016720 [Nitrososphaera viennensis EN76]|uniref:Uncharacterized protein n=1 Tax=Nitrososphaera viennensis EN76 TaxID=926571 RepID=A0A060HL61_9ARCH|nr:hypothetical protein NVIE_016720 [Nitrososphaera viennensis EN76]
MLVIVEASEKPKSILPIESHKGSMLQQKESTYALTQKYYAIIISQDGNKLAAEFLYSRMAKEV